MCHAFSVVVIILEIFSALEIILIPLFICIFSKHVTDLFTHISLPSLRKKKYPNDIPCDSKLLPMLKHDSPNGIGATVLFIGSVVYFSSSVLVA